MFQISRRTDYAVRIMVELALSEEDNPVASRVISSKTQVPKPFLHKIAADLAKAGLVRTYAGPKGGLSLAQPVEDVNMRHIVEAIEGPILLNICLLQPKECPRDEACAGHQFWADMQTLLIEELESGSLDQLRDEAIELRNHPRDRNDIPYLYPEILN